MELDGGSDAAVVVSADAGRWPHRGGRGTLALSISQGKRPWTLD
jgi:hypothetical protein